MSLYRVAVQDSFAFQSPIKSRSNTPPQFPNKGDRYLITSSASGDWSGKTDYITYYTGTGWSFVAPDFGYLVYVIDESAFYFYDEGWTKFTSGGPGGGPQPSDVYLTIYGDAFTGNKIVAFVIGPELNGKTLHSVYIKSDIAPIGGNLVCDVRKNNVTVFTNQTNRPKILNGQTSGVSGTPDIQSLATSDLLSIDINEVGATVAGGNNLYITIHFTV